MPTGYVKKMAKKHHYTVKKSENIWNKAKKAAKDQGKADNFALITSIYKKMLKESSFLDYIDTDFKVLQ